MQNKLLLNSIIVKTNRIAYQYTVTGPWSQYFSDAQLFMEYNVGISDLPHSIAAVPFLCNILPLMWLFDAEVTIDKLDEDFYKSIHDFKCGYERMYPMLSFGGSLVYSELVKHHRPGNGTIFMFSGGVDATYTYITRRHRHPTLFTLWGADTALDDERGWSNRMTAIRESAKDWRVNAAYCKTNFKEILNYEALDKYAGELANENWWHGFQHGIGIASHAAPYAFTHGMDTVFMASTFTGDTNATCASHPSIEGNLEFCGCTVVHDGYEKTRQQKIQTICDYAKEHADKPIHLHVCWVARGGENCCACEKCCRTILGIIAEGSDPNKLGFNVDLQVIKQCKSVFLKTNAYSPEFITGLWFDVQKRMRENKEKIMYKKQLNWFLNYNMFKSKSKRIFKHRIHKRLSKIFNY